MTEGLVACLLMLAALSALAMPKRWQGLVLTGLLLGIASLVRPPSFLVVPFAAWVLARRDPSQPKAGRRAAIYALSLAALASAVVLPWTLRNCRVMDGCAVVSTNGGWNLAIGALTKSGRFQTLKASDGCPDVRGQVQQDRCWAKVGLDHIKATPGAWLSKVPLKLGHTYDHESFAIEYLREANPEAWPEARRVAGRQLLSLYHRLLLVIAALCIVGRVPLRMRRPFLVQAALGWAILAVGLYATVSLSHPFYLLPAFLPLVAWLPLPGRPGQGATGIFLLGLLLTTSLTHAVFFGDDRYHLVVSPALCILAAAAFRPAKNLRRKRTE